MILLNCIDGSEANNNISVYGFFRFVRKGFADGNKNGTPQNSSFNSQRKVGTISEYDVEENLGRAGLFI